ncbi:MAG: hypothetical protein MSG64_06520 [Pyrinomonadaceae bacterium MAG19_C2-C3]|nr:hypothetical protein [Pyrinomonadaceae bacterium MAG19_C2-C3]
MNFEHSILKEAIENAIEQAYKAGFTADKTGRAVHHETPDEYAYRRAAMYRQSIEIPNPAQGELSFPAEVHIYPPGTTDTALQNLMGEEFARRYWRGFHAGISKCEGVVIEETFLRDLDESTLAVVKKIEDGMKSIPSLYPSEK